MNLPAPHAGPLAIAALSCLLSLQASSQQAAGPQPLNASISDVGTSFIIDPPPICPHCLETELGFEAVSDSRTLPAVVTIAPFKTATDVSVLVDLLDSESSGGDRTTQFGDRFDFVLRQQVFTKAGFLLTLAPRGAVFTRGAGRGRAGATAMPQLSWGRNLLAANITYTTAIGASAANPKNDYQDFADYFRTLDHTGYALFLGFAHELSAGRQTAGTEEGFVIPFRSGQVELETAQLDLNTKPEYQFQARVIVNWGKVLAHK
jgi:hypothetical protein